MKLSQSLLILVSAMLGAQTVPGEVRPSLSLEQAHQVALRNHPRISVAELSALASRQVVRQARAGLLPQLSANAVAVGTADDNTRLAAIGGLNNPAIFNRNAEGLVISQLITDFGRTLNLSRSAGFRARAAEEQVQATREQILLTVDNAYFSALQAQAVTKVARQTLTNRQILLEQVTALATNKLRSDLDISFARVSVEDAQLLLSRAQNDLQAGFTRLGNVMGMTTPVQYRLCEEPLPAPVSTNIVELVDQALRDRPDLLSLRNQHEAALRFAKAERALRYPTLSAVGSAGVVPVRDPELPPSYAAAGAILTLPLYVGGLYSAREQEATLRAEAAAQALRDSENSIISDVRISWLNAQNALDRLRIARRLLENARQTLTLAQARYQNGLSSIVEINQAELNEVSAEISRAQTQYEYLLQRSTLSYQTGALR